MALARPSTGTLGCHRPELANGTHQCNEDGQASENRRPPSEISAHPRSARQSQDSPCQKNSARKRGAQRNEQPAQCEGGQGKGEPTPDSSEPRPARNGDAQPEQGARQEPKRKWIDLRREEGGEAERRGSRPACKRGGKPEAQPELEQAPSEPTDDRTPGSADDATEPRASNDEDETHESCQHRCRPRTCAQGGRQRREAPREAIESSHKAVP